MLLNAVLDHPLVLFIVSLLALWGLAWLGVILTKRHPELSPSEDLALILGASLTLLALIIGFSFSMATSRYDVRKTNEEAEANAIGTEYLRAELLPVATAADLQSLLRIYTGQRISYYESDGGPQLQTIDAQTSQVQTKLWSLVRRAALAKPTAESALAVAGMNDVLNSQGYTQASWWNRIPTAAWCLMWIVAACSNILIGYASHESKRRSTILIILPLLASIAFMLIADLDSPRHGLIRVDPQNLLSLSDSLRKL